jgi:hypothetical protein
VLCLQTPGTGQAFFHAASEPSFRDVIDGPVDFARVLAAAQEQGGLEILGPPPFAAASATH